MVNYTGQINKLGYAAEIKLALLGLVQDFKRLEDCDIDRLFIVRHKLNEIKTPRKYRPLIMGCLHLVNLIFSERTGTEPHRDYRRNEDRVTDHGVCRALERVYGVDVAKLKDQIYRELKSSPKAVIKGKKIITVLP